MIHDEIVTFEVAKLAKEKGFDWMPSMYFHSGVESDLRVVGVNGANPNKMPHSPHISCPTQTQLQRWLREEKGIVIDVVLDWQYNIEVEEIRYQYRIGSKRRMTIEGVQTRGIVRDRYFATYELALEDAELYVLKNLV